VEGSNVEAPLRGRSPGDTVEVLVARDGRMLTRAVVLDPPRLERVKLVAKADAPVGARAAFAAWLGQPHPLWAARQDLLARPEGAAPPGPPRAKGTGT
jgi:hypothetical protein